MQYLSLTLPLFVPFSSLFSAKGGRDGDGDGDRALRSSSRTSGIESIVQSLRGQIDSIAEDDRDLPAEKVTSKCKLIILARSFEL
jgi:hypothetical protein